MDIAIQPLPGHPFTLKAQVAIRSPYELLGSSANQSTGAENVQLTHPPVLLKQDGGGELLLNRDSVIAQLNLSGKKGKKAAKVPKTILVWLIDLRQLDSHLDMLTRFLFGPLQRLHYEKKDSDHNILWRQTIQLIQANPVLKSNIESALFDGETLSNRHYMLLLSAAKLSVSSVDHELGRQQKVPSMSPLKGKKASSSAPILDTAKNTNAVRKKAEKQQNWTEIELPKTVTADAQWTQPEETKPFDMRLEEVLNRAIQKAPLKIVGDL